MKHKRIYNAFILLISSSLFLSSCVKIREAAPTKGTGNTFGIVAGTSTDSYLLQAGSLSDGTISTAGNGIEMSAISQRGYLVDAKDGYYYNVDFDVNWAAYKFSKYKFDNGQVQWVKQIPYPATDHTIRWKVWIDDNTLLIGGECAGGLSYDIFNVNDMTVMATGSIQVHNAAALPNGWVDQTGQYRNGRLYFFYNTYNDDYTATDTTYSASVAYPSLTDAVYGWDTRSVCPGTGSWSPSSFQDNGNIYVLSSPLDGNGGRADKPFGLWKINSGEDKFDPSYFLDITAITGSHNGVSVFYAGNGKAIVNVARKGLVTQLDDIYSKAVYDFYVVDVNLQTATKLDVPLSFCNLAQTYVKEGDVAYFVINSEAGGPMIYAYNSATGSLTKGLHIEGANDAGQLYKAY